MPPDPERRLHRVRANEFFRKPLLQPFDGVLGAQAGETLFT